jgi:RNA polymerase sigma-70 factor (ECF subfamily)
VPLEHWVSRIAVNTCLNQLQAEKIRPELRWADLSEEEAAVLDSLGGTSDDLPPGDSCASREVVDKLLAGLNPPDRLVIHLLHLDGYSLEEVRQRTGWNIALVKVRAFRARQKLKKIFEQLTREGKL